MCSYLLSWKKSADQGSDPRWTKWTRIIHKQRRIRILEILFQPYNVKVSNTPITGGDIDGTLQHSKANKNRQRHDKENPTTRENTKKSSRIVQRIVHCRKKYFYFIFLFCFRSPKMFVVFIFKTFYFNMVVNYYILHMFNDYTCSFILTYKQFYFTAMSYCYVDGQIKHYLDL